MENNYNHLVTAIVDTIRKEALGPDWKKAATAYPLSAYGGWNDPDHWWGTSAKRAKSRVGNPTITVRNGGDWVASVMTSKGGKNAIIFVDEDVEVVVVKDGR